ncbi:MAG: prepilin-type N-terminal cleavage/methylation domain-containing protein [Patescibacteria group bacterium]
MRKGFTLVEILIVIFIIGLLSSIVLVGLGSFRARGRDARRVADLHSLQNGLELYFSKEGIYPDTNVTSVAGWEVFSDKLINAGIGVNVVPADPAAPSGRYYEYGVNSDGLNYVLKATLEDPNNPVLREDIDGNVYGVNCNDSTTSGNYCIQF